MRYNVTIKINHGHGLSDRIQKLFEANDPDDALGLATMSLDTFLKRDQWAVIKVAQLTSD